MFSARLARTLAPPHGTLDSSKTACRAGALMLLVAFWFDGGLFTLATASVFWILLELGNEKAESGNRFEAANAANQGLL